MMEENLMAYYNQTPNNQMMQQFFGGAPSELSTGTSDIVDLTINTIIKVCPSCCAIDNSAAISVVNTGIGAIYSNTTITITKIA